MAVLLSDKVNFKRKECCFIMINVSVHQEDITILNTDNRVSKYMERELIKLKGKQTNPL